MHFSPRQVWRQTESVFKSIGLTIHVPTPHANTFRFSFFDEERFVILGGGSRANIYPVRMSNEVQHLPWSAIPATQLNPLLSRQFAHGTQAMVSRIELRSGCIVPTHAHPNEQISIVLSGSMIFTVGAPGDEREIKVLPNEVLVLPGNVPHSALALEDSVNLDLFAPPREDWITGNDAYLRGGKR